VDDPYLYPGTEVLRNKGDKKTLNELREWEAEKTNSRLNELDVKPLPGKFDLPHLQAIHKYIFQDVYSWAGKLRTINAPKLDLHGRWATATRFTDFRAFPTEAPAVFARLAKDGFLQGASREVFLDKGAQLLADINHLHCFREGNGRTQKCFLEHLAAHAGYSLDFSLVSKGRMIAASSAAESKDIAPMRHMLDDISDPTKRNQLGSAIAMFKRTGFNWNDRELACVQPGTSYAGVFVERGGDDMLFHDGKQGIWIGHYPDVGRELKPGERFSYTALSEAERWERTSVEMIKTDLASGIAPEQIVNTLAHWQSERGDKGFFRGLVERAMTPEQKTQWHHDKTVEMPTAAIKQIPPHRPR
jgi:fido (protein-threonine AMPylation protein)